MDEVAHARLLEALEKSVALEPEPKENNVVNFAVERLSRKGEDLRPQDIAVTDLLSLIQSDVAKYGDVTKCYVTLVREDEKAFTVVNYRAGVSRVEEIALRQLGVQEVIDSWRFGDGEG